MWAKQAKPTDRIPSPLMGEESKARVKKDNQAVPHRHSRVSGKPQGGTVTRQHQPHRAVILASRQYPQNDATHRHNPVNPHNPENPDSKTNIHPTLWFPAYAGMTVRDAGNDGPVNHLPTGAIVLEQLPRQLRLTYQLLCLKSQSLQQPLWHT